MRSLKNNNIVCSDSIIKSAETESGGWAIYSNGLAEQFGYVDIPSVTSKVVQLYFPYKNTKYSCVTIVGDNTNDTGGYTDHDGALSGDSTYDHGLKVDCFRVTTRSSSTYRLFWQTKGFVNLEDPIVKKFIEEHQ
jgi:hypothetical protein